MRYEYTHLIPENVAPLGATEIIFTNGTKEICDIPAARFGWLTPPAGNLTTRYLVLSDIHIGTARAADFQAALDFAESDPACKFVVICGDLVNDGADDTQRTTYKTMISAMTKPVYSIAGNHDTIWGYPTDEHMKSYTVDCTGHGYPLYYAVAKNADTANRVYANEDVPDDLLLICLGHYGKDHSGGNGDWRGGEQFSAEELAWFESIMSANPNKRRRVFIHPYIPDTAGNPPLTVTPPNRPPNLWEKKDTVSTDAGADFLRILDSYPGAVVVNGHSHYRFCTQEEQSTAIVYKPPSGNYTIIHTPSTTKLRDVRNGQRKDLTPSDADYGGEGYVVDEHEDCTHFRGRDFVNGKWVGLGTYKIDT